MADVFYQITRSYLRLLIAFKCGDSKGLIMDPYRDMNDKKSSLWWRHLRLAHGSLGDDNNWFRNNVSSKLGDISFIDFLA